MKPASFEYLAPESLEAAAAAMGQHGSEARLLAGGQSLVASMNFRCLTPAYLVDLNPLTELDFVRAGADGELRIGAMTRYRTLEFHPAVQAHSPVMHHAIPYIAHTAIRTRGTMGGSLAYADPAAELPAVTLALGARYRAVSVRGVRWIPADEFYVDSFATALEPTEVLVEVAIPAMPARTGWGFQEFARRHGDRVMMGVTGLVSLDENGVVQKAALAYQNAARTPMRARRAEQILLAQRGTSGVIQAAAESAAQEVDPADDAHATAAFRRSLARELTRRVLLQAFERAGSAGERKNGHVTAK